MWTCDAEQTSLKADSFHIQKLQCNRTSLVFFRATVLDLWLGSPPSIRWSIFYFWGVLALQGQKKQKEEINRPPTARPKICHPNPPPLMISYVLASVLLVKDTLEKCLDIRVKKVRGSSWIIEVWTLQRYELWDLDPDNLAAEDFEGFAAYSSTIQPAMQTTYQLSHRLFKPLTNYPF